MRRSRKRGRIPVEELGQVEAMADDILHYASGAGWDERGINAICRALGWPKVGYFVQGVKWAKPDRNFVECVSGGFSHGIFERLRGAGLAEIVGLRSGARVEYKITPKGMAVAHLRHMAIREAEKALREAKKALA